MAFWIFLTQPRLTRNTWHSPSKLLLTPPIEDISALVSFLLKRITLVGSFWHPCACVLLSLCYFSSHPVLKVKSNITSPLVPAFASWHWLLVTWLWLPFISQRISAVCLYLSSVLSCEIITHRLSKMSKIWWYLFGFSIVWPACYTRKRGLISWLFDWKILQDTEPSVWSRRRLVTLQCES